MPLLLDRYGVVLGAKEDGAVTMFDGAVHSLVALIGDPVAAASAAVAADDEIVLARCLQAYLHCYLTSGTAYSAAGAIVDGAPKAACSRDQAHLEAASAWSAGNLEVAVGHLEQTLLEDPRDLLALKVAQDLYFFLGDRVNLRDVVARVLPAWPTGAPGSGFVEAMYAFGLEECGDYRAAERHGRAALDADRHDVWAAHAVIHVLEMEGRQLEGLAFVKASAPDWSPSYFAVHNWWHSALYHLELGEEAKALAVYDGPVRARGLTSPLDRVDAASLLWRLSLQGTGPGGRAEELAEVFAVDLGGSTYCFNDWHALMALGLAGRLDLATEFVASLPGKATGTNKTMLDRAGLDVVQGMLAFARGDHARAVHLLGRARPYASAMGGSHAQRDAIDLTLLAAAAAARHEALVRALVAERVARKPTAETAARLVVEASRARGGRALSRAPEKAGPTTTTTYRNEVEMTTDRYEALEELALLEEDAAEFGLPWERAPTVARGSVPTSDGEVSFLNWGAGEPEIVLLHGVALNAHTWDVFALATNRPLLALDLPGHGSSAWRDDGRYDPAAITPAVAEVIGKQAPGAAVVVGQSLGGLIAIALGESRPDLVRRLVLVDVSPGIVGTGQVRSFLSGPGVFASRQEIVERARAFGLGHSREAVARGVWHNTRMREDGLVTWKHHVGNMEGGPTFAVDFSTLWPALESFAGPVLLVRGERGFLSRANVDELRRRVPGAQVVEVPSGHNVQEEQPVLLAEVVSRFLDSTV